MTARDVFGLVLRLVGAGLFGYGFAGGAYLLFNLVGIVPADSRIGPLAAAVGAVYWLVFGLLLLAYAHRIVGVVYGARRGDSD